jgi:hypothetical protein
MATELSIQGGRATILHVKYSSDEGADREWNIGVVRDGSALAVARREA